MYKVYGKVFSRAQRVMWMLEELGQPWELVDAGPHSPEVLALNPSGKVPVFTEDGKVLLNSSAMLTYLADKHGQLTFAAGTWERAQQDSLLHLVLDELDALLWTAARHGFILPEEQRVGGLKPSLQWEFARNLARVESRLQGPFLMGETMTIADIVLTHCLGWAYTAKFPIESERLLAYSKSMRARPAFRRVLDRAPAQ